MDCCKASIVMRATRQVALEIELLREEEPTASGKIITGSAIKKILI